MSSSSSTTATTTAATTRAAARGTLLSILLRLTSFLLSQLTVRFVSASALGKASIPLELLLGTALFVGREGFRLALTKEISGSEGGRTRQHDNCRNDNDDDKNKEKGGVVVVAEEEDIKSQRIVNVSWLSIPTGACLSAVALCMHLYSCNHQHQNQQQFTQHDTTNVNINDLNNNDNNNKSLDILSAFDYKLAGILYCLASFIESLAEPLVIRCLQEMDVTTKAKAEGMALLCRAASCFACLYFMGSMWFKRWVEKTMMLDHHHPHYLSAGQGDGDGFREEVIDSYTKSNNYFAVTAFGISQLVYALVFTIIIYRRGKLTEGGIRWPKRILYSSKSKVVDNPYRDNHNDNNNNKKPIKSIMMTSSFLSQNLDTHTLHLVLIFTLQGILKHGLTEADKIVLSTLADSYDQGVYALAASYGGLAARLLLQPMEENARLLFSRQGAIVAKHANEQKQANAKTANDGTKKSEMERNNTQHANNVNSFSASFDQLKELEDTYCFLLRGVLYIGLLFATIASNYTSLLLRILAGQRWGSNAEASAALSAFCVYTAFLALNGTTEAFVYGVARSGKEVGALGVVHAIIGGVFALLAPSLVRRSGAVGLVTTNCICMAMRSIYSLYYANRYFSTNGLALVSSEGGRRGMMAFRILPHPLVLLLFCASYLATLTSTSHLYDAPIAAGARWIVQAPQHVAVGITCAMTVVMTSFYFDRELRLALRRIAKKKSS